MLGSFRLVGIWLALAPSGSSNNQHAASTNSGVANDDTVKEEGYDWDTVRGPPSAKKTLAGGPSTVTQISVSRVDSFNSKCNQPGCMKPAVSKVDSLNSKCNQLGCMKLLQLAGCI